MEEEKTRNNNLLLLRFVFVAQQVAQYKILGIYDASKKTTGVYLLHFKRKIISFVPLSFFLLWRDLRPESTQSGSLWVSWLFTEPDWHWSSRKPVSRSWLSTSSVKSGFSSYKHVHVKEAGLLITIHITGTMNEVLHVIPSTCGKLLF